MRIDHIVTFLAFAYTGSCQIQELGSSLTTDRSKWPVIWLTNDAEGRTSEMVPLKGQACMGNHPGFTGFETSKELRAPTIRGCLYYYRTENCAGDRYGGMPLQPKMDKGDVGEWKPDDKITSFWVSETYCELDVSDVIYGA